MPGIRDTLTPTGQEALDQLVASDTVFLSADWGKSLADIRKKYTSKKKADV